MRNAWGLAWVLAARVGSGRTSTNVAIPRGDPVRSVEALQTSLDSAEITSGPVFPHRQGTASSP